MHVHGLVHERTAAKGSTGWCYTSKRKRDIVVLVVHCRTVVQSSIRLYSQRSCGGYRSHGGYRRYTRTKYDITPRLQPQQHQPLSYVPGIVMPGAWYMIPGGTTYDVLLVCRKPSNGLRTVIQPQIITAVPVLLVVRVKISST